MWEARKEAVRRRAENCFRRAGLAGTEVGVCAVALEAVAAVVRSA